MSNNMEITYAELKESQYVHLRASRQASTHLTDNLGLTTGNQVSTQDTMKRLGTCVRRSRDGVRHKEIKAKNDMSSAWQPCGSECVQERK
jgi:hypothetical protein